MRYDHLPPCLDSKLNDVQLHFARPSAYHEIYNNSARWDKEATLYRSFGEDRSSFGYLTYREAKERKDILQPLFSRRAIVNMQGLIQQNVRTCGPFAWRIC